MLLHAVQVAKASPCGHTSPNGTAATRSRVQACVVLPTAAAPAIRDRPHDPAQITWLREELTRRIEFMMWGPGGESISPIPDEYAIAEEEHFFLVE